MSMKKAKKEMRDWGKDLATDAEFFPEDKGREFGMIASMNRDGILQGAWYANTLLPRTRELAGCKDAGFGTFTGCTDEDRHIQEELLDEFWSAYDKQLRKEWKKWKRSN